MSNRLAVAKVMGIVLTVAMYTLPMVGIILFGGVALLMGAPTVTVLKVAMAGLCIALPLSLFCRIIRRTNSTMISEMSVGA